MKASSYISYLKLVRLPQTNHFVLKKKPSKLFNFKQNEVELAGYQIPLGDPGRWRWSFMKGAIKKTLKKHSSVFGVHLSNTGTLPK